MATSPNITILEKIIDARHGFLQQYGYYPNTIILSDEIYSDLNQELVDRYDFNAKVDSLRAIEDTVLGMDILRSSKKDKFQCIRID